MSLDRVFIPSRLVDNPYVDYASYVASLAELEPVERARLLSGDWDVRAKGSMFDRSDMPIVDDWPRDAQVCRYWDLAATDSLDADDPDWTAGGKVAIKDGQVWLVHMDRFQKAPGEVEKLVRLRADLDVNDHGIGFPTIMEEEGGATGKHSAFHWKRRVMVGLYFVTVPKRNSKIEAARAVSAAAKNGNLFVVRGDWNEAWFNEADTFPQDGFHDDQVDTLSGGFNWLNGAGRAAAGGLQA